MFEKSLPRRLRLRALFQIEIRRDLRLRVCAPSAGFVYRASEV
jgi:hypothetical protein